MHIKNWEKRLTCICFLPFFFLFPPPQILEQKKIAVVVPSYNNAQWYEKNLDSIFMQDYSNYTVYYLDDCSTDGTADLVENYIKSHHLAHKCILKKFPVREGKLKHMYDVYHELDDWIIIVQVDGDDWLAHDQVFNKINELYSTQDIWITYGQAKGWRSSMKIAQPISSRRLKQGDFRSSWTYSHLHTFYAWLFKKIRRDDLICQSVPGCIGSWYFVADDVAFMTPMLEMARHHFKFIDEVLYIYNDPPTMRHQQPKGLEDKDAPLKLVQEILAKPPYQALHDAPLL